LLSGFADWQWEKEGEKESDFGAEIGEMALFGDNTRELCRDWGKGLGMC
jgi:hypothetical protein